MEYHTAALTKPMWQCEIYWVKYSRCTIICVLETHLCKNEYIYAYKAISGMIHKTLKSGYLQRMR